MCLPMSFTAPLRKSYIRTHADTFASFMSVCKQSGKTIDNEAERLRERVKKRQRKNDRQRVEEER